MFSFGIGSNLSNIFSFNPRPSSPNLQVRFNQRASSAMSVAESQRQLLGASTALTDAIRQFKTETRPVYSTSVSTSNQVGSALSGLSARLTPVGTEYSSLQTTAKINTQTSTDRSSLSSLGLDVTSPETASTLDSSAALGLDLVALQSSITSTAEMNTAPTSIENYILDDFANSTTVATLSGEYTGVGSAEDSTRLKVILKTNTTLDGTAQTVRFLVKDNDGTKLVDWTGSLKAGDQVYLGDDIGLTISFSEGTWQKGNRSKTYVYHTPTEVDPNATFNNSDPNLRPRFENGQQVTAGSFTIDGTSITVNANDTLNTVIARINASCAGVTASLANDQITLTSNSPSEVIDLANDTSGFLTAVKLDGASATGGNIADDVQALKDTPLLGGVTNGSFVVDGQTIDVDTNVDTVQTIVAKINSSGARVVAAYDPVQDKISIDATYNSEDDVPIGSDTSGFLAAANLSAGNSVRGNIRDDQQVFSKTTQFGSVTSGSFQINGVSISVDPAQDSLEGLIGQINSSGAGVTAAYNSTTDKLEITPDVAGATLVIEGDTSGFLAAANIAEGAEGTHVNADAAFNGTGLNSPLFDPGLTVQAGSFTVDGVTITVAADDTVNTVLDKITASAAGVTATYDDATQTVNLTKQGTTDPIILAGDTSGFLAAVKFDGTEDSTSGGSSISAFDAVFNTMTEYSSVGAGTITVNGSQISIDPATTTINGLVSQLNAIEDLSATLNQTTGEIQVSSSSGTIDIADTSGLLSVLGVAPGTYQTTGGPSIITTTTQTGTETVSNASELAENVSEAAARLNDVLSELFRVRGTVSDPTNLESILQRKIDAMAARSSTGTLSLRGSVQEDNSVRHHLESALQRAFDSLTDTGLAGLTLSTEGGQLRVSVDQTTLANSLTSLLGDATDPASALVSLLDGFTAETTAAFSAQPASAPPSDELSPLDLSTLIKAHIHSTQMMGLTTLGMVNQAYTGTNSVFGESESSSLRWLG